MAGLSVDAWGALAHPIREHPPAESAPWKDNAYLGFWDPEHDVYGTIHVSTSPNSRGTLARASLSVRGRAAEVAEELAPASFTSPSIAFDLAGRITVDAPGLRAKLELAPLFTIGDYRATDIVADLVRDAPLQHVEQFARVTGEAEVAGETTTVDGVGFRDRTWGYRDESVSIPEYFALMAVFPGHGLVGLRFAQPDGGERTAGFRLDDDTALAVSAVAPITRDASGLFAAVDVTLADGQRLHLRRTRRTAGFWVPMGWERTAPTLSAYDEFVEIRTDRGDTGFGIVEQGIIRQLV